VDFSTSMSSSPAWYMFTAELITCQWLQEVVIKDLLKQAFVQPILKKPNLVSSFIFIN